MMWRVLVMVWMLALAGVMTVVAGRGTPPVGLTAYLDTDSACFMDICRGVTTADEAEAILHAQPHITGVRRRENSGGGTIFWHYDPVPAGLSASRRSELIYEPDTGIVQDVKISVSVPLWKLALSGGLGSPVRVMTYRGQVHRYVQAAWRSGHDVMMAGGRVGCPLSSEVFWKTRVTLIQFPPDIAAADLAPYYAVPYNTICETN
jgi:hypothetical protein